MARYRLYNKDGSPVTAEQLPTIPAKIAMATLTQPVKPADYTGHDTESYMIYHQAMAVYLIAKAAYKLQYQIALANYMKQYTDFAAVLQSQFSWAVGRHVHTDKGVQWIYEVTGDGYNYVTAAQRLIGYTSPPAPVGFIINGYFGY